MKIDGMFANGPCIWRIELNDEGGCTGPQFGSATFFINDEQVATIEAFVDQKQGADGGWYNTVSFRKPTPQTPAAIGRFNLIGDEL